MADNGWRRHHQSTVKLVRYPIRSATPERVHADLLHELIRTEVRRDVTCGAWDTAIHICKASIKRIKKRKSQRTRRLRRRVQGHARAHLSTRHSLMQSMQKELQTAQTVRQGLRLERTMDSLRWQFKRVSNWERDQSISGLDQINGRRFLPGDTVANHFASEWSPIPCRTHKFPGASAQLSIARFCYAAGRSRSLRRC